MSWVSSISSTKRFGRLTTPLLYRLHDKRLPGSPDLIFPSRKKAIFVHGCFWHQHNVCRHGHRPKAHPEYWLPKLRRNIARDELAQRQLMQLGWTSLVIWECELTEFEQVSIRLDRFLPSNL